MEPFAAVAIAVAITIDVTLRLRWLARRRAALVTCAILAHADGRPIDAREIAAEFGMTEAAVRQLLADACAAGVLPVSAEVG